METKDVEIINKLIKEQDLACLYSINSDDIALESYSEQPYISVYKISEYFLKDPETLEKLSTKNLLKLITNVDKENEEQKNRITNLIMKRFENGEFLIEDIDVNIFMKPYYSARVAFIRLGVENINKIADNIKSELKELKDTHVEKVTKGLNLLGDKANFLKYYKDGIFSAEKIELLEKMLQEDKNAFDHMNFGIFQDDIFNMGEEFVQYISKFPKLSTELVILQKNNPKLLKILSNRVQQYESLPDNYDEIEYMIKYFTRKAYDINLDKIDDKISEDLLDCAVRRDNANVDSGKIKIEYSENYKEKLEKEFLRLYEDAQNAYIESDVLEKKKNVYLNKRFAMSIKEAKSLIEDYATDLDNIDGIQEEDKALFQEIKEILDKEDETEIDELFAKCDIEYGAVDLLQLKNRVAKIFALDYAQNLKKSDDQIQNSGNEEQNIEFEGKNIRQIKLKGQFDILVHSSDSGFINEREIDENTDFTELWKNGPDKSNHIISMSFINQDFLGCAPVNKNGVMYGFTNISPEKIKLMGVTDINSYSRNFAYSSVERKYMSAKTMPYSSRRVYNEFGTEREGVNPDYVILFDDMSEEVKNNTYKATSQFGIPVLYIDKKEIEQQQLRKLQELMNEFNDTKDPEILKRLLNTYETNVAGWLLNRSNKEKDETYTQDIDNSRFKTDFDEIWISIKKTIDTYISQISQSQEQVNKKNIGELTRIMEIVLEERDLYQRSEETKPITKTKLSYDAQSIIENINQAFETLGASEYIVQTKEIPTAEQYKINMKNIMNNSLFGSNKVNIEDIQKVERDLGLDLEETKEEEEK